MTIDMRYCFRKNDQILGKELDGEIVLIDPYRRTKVTLNPTAARIWGLVDGGHSTAEIVTALRDAFEIGEEEAKKDVVYFLKELARREMIR